MSEPGPHNQLTSKDHEFWDQRWDADRIPWDLHGIPAQLNAFLTRTEAGCRLRVLIPGCGSGYEVRAFHETGHDVVAIDFSAPAVAHARAALGELGDRVSQGDFFLHEGGPYDLIYERGFLCSLPTEMWPDYAAKMARLLAPGGRLVGLFLYGEEPEPPPFPLTVGMAQNLFGSRFCLLDDEDESAVESVPVYQGMEHWQEWERLPDA